MSVLTEILISSLFSLLLAPQESPEQKEPEQQTAVVEMTSEEPIHDCASYEP